MLSKTATHNLQRVCNKNKDVFWIHYIARRMKQGLRLNALISKNYFIICNDNQITINLNMYLYQYIKNLLY